MESKYDIENQRFGKLIAIKRVEDYITPSGQKYIRWLCKCDCGNYKEIVANSLIYGRTKSCGCLRSNLVSKRLKSFNKYDLSNEYGIGYTSNNIPFYFDLEDYDRIKDYCWCIDDKGYVLARDTNNKKSIKFHKILFPNDMVDHINHNKADNRKINLRIVSHSQNNMNKTLQSNNTSGTSGVKWSKRDCIWEADITFQGKRYYLGRFKNYDDAVKARKVAEKQYFGEYSYDNSMKNADKIKE